MSLARVIQIDTGATRFVPRAYVDSTARLKAREMVIGLEQTHLVAHKIGTGEVMVDFETFGANRSAYQHPFEKDCLNYYE